MTRPPARRKPGPQTRVSRWKPRLAWLAVTAVILHGSLYPYAFRVPPGGAGPLATLIGSWAVPPSSRGDLLANLLLYMPFGFIGALAIGGGRARRLLTMTAAGLLLCVAVELSQYYDADRVTNLSDVYLNTAGAGLGAAAAILLRQPGRRLLPGGLAPNPIPLLLLAGMLGYHLFPYVPTIDLHKYWHALRPLVLYPSFAKHLILRYAALWLTTSYLVGAITGYRLSRAAVPLLVLAVFAAKIVITDLVLTLPEVIGAAVAVALWLGLGGRRRTVLLLTIAVLIVALVIERLEPLQFTATARDFGWLPFRSFLAGSLAINTMSFLQKFFLYGSLIWLASEARLPLWLATGMVAAMLLATSVAELYLPGRSGEITDAVLALLIGVVFAALRRRRPA